MDTELAIRYKNTDTEELIKIAFINKNNYRTEAVEIATQELLSRGITSQSEIALKKTQEQIEKTQEQIEESKKQIEESKIRDNTPLEPESKFIFFICGMVPLFFIIALFVISHQEKKRGKRKTKESWKWLWFGLGSFYALILLFGFLSRID